MNQDIHTHLEKLKTELGKLEPAVKHLQQADGNATALITSLTNIHKEFAKHLESIEKSLADANDKHQKQLTKEIQDSTKKITNAAEQLSNSNSSFEKQIKTFLSGYEGLSQSAAKLMGTINEVDFPTRFAELHSSIGIINQEQQNIQTRISDLERNIRDDIQAKSRELTSKVEATENLLKQKLDNSEKNAATQFEKISSGNKMLKILLFVSIGISVMIIAIHFLKL